MITKGSFAALKLMEACGIDNVIDFPLELLVSGRRALLVEEDLSNADGRIVFGKNLAIITINSQIEYSGKRRFVIAHEIGHLEMHRDHLMIHNDTDYTLDYFKSGDQESEANEFAAELLMPMSQFRASCYNKPFTPDLCRNLADYFMTSLTSTVYRYREANLHPICLIYSHNNSVIYWKKSEDFNYRMKDITKLPPPSDSIASEYFRTGKIYPKSDSKQEISKSTWLELNKYEVDSAFFEYCIITPKYNTVLSVIWEA